MSRNTKEGIVLVIDCGKSMSQKCLNCDKSVFESSKQCLEYIIRQKVFAESKNEYLLIEYSTTTGVGVKINGRLRSPNFELLKYITDRLKISDPNSDSKSMKVMNALNEGINELITQTKYQKFTSLKLALFTNFNGLNHFDLNRFRSDISPKLSQNAIQLIIISDFTQNNKPFERQSSECRTLALELMEVVEKSSLGFCYDLETAIKTFSEFEGKKTSPYPWYSKLELGKGLNALNIPIAAYIKATPYQRKRPNTLFKPTDISETSSQIPTQEIRGFRYGQTEVPISEDIKKASEVPTQEIRGFRYGQTDVPINEEIKKALIYDNNEKGFKIIGFTSLHNIDISQRMNTKTTYVFPDPRPKQNNHKMIFHTLVCAMVDQQKVAIVRYSYGDRTTPQIGYLFPLKEDSNLLLSYIQLPFAEDIHKHRFPSLESNTNVCPNEKQLEIIDKLIDSMDLMTADTDEDGIECEALKTDQISDPLLQHWFHCLYHKNLNQIDCGLPQMSEELRNSIQMPTKLSKDVINPLKEILEGFTLEASKEKLIKKRIQPKVISSQSISSTETHSKRQRTDFS